MSMPSSYSIDEMREISAAMDASTAEVDAAMRADFEQLPADARSKLLDMLCRSGVENPDWWWDILVGEGDPLYRELETI